MPLELRPLGVKCNIRCAYCYQQPQRDVGNITKRYDIARLKAAIEAANTEFVLFGGEPLLVPIGDLEELWRFGFERFGRNGIQTNGTLITDEHIRLFKAFNVHVGISIDGPGPLNDARSSGSLEATRRSTAHTCAAIERLCAEGIIPSIIVTLHRANGVAEKLPALAAWFQTLDVLGMRSVRLHVLESEYEAVRTTLALTTEEYLRAFLYLAEVERTYLRNIRFTEFKDIQRLLHGDDNHTSCVWNACDPYTTRAVRGIEGNGQISNCGRTNKDGVEFVKSERAGYERYLALYQTPREFGGCKGCRFFLVCKGQCPGTAMNNDWRNRTEHCALWEAVYEHYEKIIEDQGVTPVSQRPDLHELERMFVEHWSRGSNPMLHSLTAALDKLGSA